MAELIRYSRERILDQLNSRLGLTSENRDSFARIISEIIGSELEAIEDEVLGMFRNEQIENLSGEELENYLFNMYNINRIPSRKASSDVFQIRTNLNQTFGEINDQNDIVIPSGTRISADANFENIVFLTQEDVTLFSDETVVFIPIIAENPGASYNCTEGALRFIEFENYTKSEEDLLRCENIYDISNGSDEESDESLRIRGITFLERKSNLNKNSLFAALLNESSIFQFEIIESYYGIGSIGVLVKGHGYGQVSENDLLKVRSIINEFEFLGQNIEVVSPREVNLNLSLTLKSPIELEENEKILLENEIKTFIVNELKSMEFRKQINIREVYNGILNNFNVLKLNNTQFNFDTILMNKIERFETDLSYLNIDPLGISTIELEVDETFANPIVNLSILNPL